MALSKIGQCRFFEYKLVRLHAPCPWAPGPLAGPLGAYAPLALTHALTTGMLLHVHSRTHVHSHTLPSLFYAPRPGCLTHWMDTHAVWTCSYPTLDGLSRSMDMFLSHTFDVPHPPWVLSLTQFGTTATTSTTLTSTWANAISVSRVEVWLLPVASTCCLPTSSRPGGAVSHDLNVRTPQAGVHHLCEEGEVWQQLQNAVVFCEQSQFEA